MGIIRAVYECYRCSICVGKMAVTGVLRRNEVVERLKRVAIVMF